MDDRKILGPFKGFSKLDYSARLNKLKELKYLTEKDIDYLKAGGDPDLSESLIENALGYFALPLGAAVNFIVNGKRLVIPFALEESSVIAAASKTARWIAENGSLTAETLGRLSTGQLQIARVKNFPRLKQSIEENFETWKKAAHRHVIPSMKKRGGGIKGHELRRLPPLSEQTLSQQSDCSKGALRSVAGSPEGLQPVMTAPVATAPVSTEADSPEGLQPVGTRPVGPQPASLQPVGPRPAADSQENGLRPAVWHVYMETCDAMGANMINQVCEYLKPLLEKSSGEKVSMCILSNLADKKLFRARAVIKNQDPELIRKIEEASFFAEQDPYRAATSNKGVLNGIDALLIATGNDWRAAEAGLHAYAARSGVYRSLSRWRVKNGALHGEMEGPLSAGVTGGVTDLHPTAALSLRMLGRPSAEELSKICMAVGLTQNLGALRALVTEGVAAGHMKLHIKNLALKAGALKPDERDFVEKHLLNILKSRKSVSLTHAYKALSARRKEQRKTGKKTSDKNKQEKTGSRTGENTAAVNGPVPL